ncbi:hypothetical protein AGOR_G00176390 [Albula goreensis]|uniref:SMB domain-containing protein n=1 Tax=Albula goreensis TaxID=1534307 RepID=A0A8T3D0E6_9TELE|nr:hypothetical protein AGOR_G00176390 [Albula goreensis]
MSLCASAPHQDWISEHRMDYPAAVFGLLLLLLSVDGQSTTATAGTPALILTTLNSNENNSTMTTRASTLTSSYSNSSFPVTQDPSFTFPNFFGKCSAYPPLCCDGFNSGCNRGCFCDVACLRLNDCCPDFTTTCVTGELNGTSVNTTAPPGNNATNMTTFPLNSYSGSCSEEPALCCSGNDYNCFRGCFCDEACIQNNDCCPDYVNTCRGDIKTVISQLRVSIRAPPGTSNQAVTAAFYNGTLRLQEYLKSIFSEIESLRLTEIIKVKKT